MKPEIKQIWIDALLSGEYEQGRGLLCHISDGNTYWCCLGVLTDLAVKSGVEIDKSLDSDSKNSNQEVFYFNGQHEKLPQAVMDWAGISTPLADFSFEDEEEGSVISLNLAEQNDNGYSFRDLVDEIESYF
jgi:hypothetical protein